MFNVGDTGFLKYKDKLVSVTVLETHGNYYIVKTEDGDILGIPPESDTHIWKSKEDYERYEFYSNIDFVPQEGGM